MIDIKCELSKYNLDNPLEQFPEWLSKLILYWDIGTKCPFCDRIFKSSKGLKNHLMKHHKSEMNYLLDTIKLKQKCICPICNIELHDLGRHLSLIHNVKTDYEFRLRYPLITLISKSKSPSKVKCKYCQSEINTINYKSHVEKYHPNEIEDYVNNKSMSIFKYESNAHYECPICHCKRNDIRQHVIQSHKINWSKFCDEYNWNINDSKFVSESYKKHLSKNKLNFYRNTDKGRELREMQSIKWKSDNIINRPDVREKLLNSVYYRFSNNDNEFYCNSRGIKIKLDYITSNKFCRSFTEFHFAYICYINKLDYSYEPVRINYINNSKSTFYIPDFKIKDDYYEIKNFQGLENFDPKYEYIKSKFDELNLNLIFTTPYDFAKDNNLIFPDYTEVIEFIKSNMDKVRIIFRSYKNNSRILSDIDPNYKFNKNISFRTLEVNKK